MGSAWLVWWAVITQVRARALSEEPQGQQSWLWPHGMGVRACTNTGAARRGVQGKPWWMTVEGMVHRQGDGAQIGGWCTDRGDGAQTGAPCSQAQV